MKNIDWHKLSTIAELLSAVAVMVTLVYLAVQTRYIAETTQQNQELLRAEAGNILMQNRNWRRQEIITNTEFASLVAKVRRQEVLTDVEQLQLAALQEMSAVSWQWEYLQWQAGNLPEFPFESLRNAFCDASGLTVNQHSWEDIKQLIESEFIVWMEANVVNSCQ
jgi:hypothetical protein